jgi:hypothetical protein
MPYRRYLTLAALAAGAACATTQSGSSPDADTVAAAQPDSVEANPGVVNTGNVALTDTMAAISQPRPVAPTSEAAQGDTVKGESTDAPTMQVDSASAYNVAAPDSAGAGAQPVESQLDATVGAAQQGLTSLAPATAVALINGFQSFLSGSDNPALTDIANDLNTLKGELSKPQVDGKAVGPILNQLGRKTITVAPSAGMLSERVASLGQLLIQNGNRLSSGN